MKTAGVGLTMFRAQRQAGQHTKVTKGPSACWSSYGTQDGLRKWGIGFVSFRVFCGQIITLLEGVN